MYAKYLACIISFSPPHPKTSIPICRDKVSNLSSDQPPCIPHTPSVKIPSQRSEPPFLYSPRLPPSPTPSSLRMGAPRMFAFDMYAHSTPSCHSEESFTRRRISAYIISTISPFYATCALEADGFRFFGLGSWGGVNKRGAGSGQRGVRGLLSDIQ